MKRIKNFPQYRRLQERHKRRTERNLRRTQGSQRKTYSASKFRRHVSRQVSQQLNFVRVVAPAEFSFVNNPEQMITFTTDLKDVLFRLHKSALIDLSSVRIVTNDAIILMLSVVQDKHLSGWIEVNVTLPNNELAAKRFKESGIEEHLGVRQVGLPKSGRIRSRSSYDADSEMANELIQHATRTLFSQRRPLKKVQRILSECIANTEEHAGGDSGRPKEKMWWGTVFCESDVAYFSLVDNGIGIIESLRAEWFSRLPTISRFPNNIMLMKAVFAGKVLSSTNLSNRGNGLPAIYRARLKMEFVRLILITNNIFIDFDKDEYRLLPKPFAGTFFYWEVRKNNDTA